MTKIILSFLLFFVTDAIAFPHQPNLDITPSDLCSMNDPDFDEFRYQENVPHCARVVSRGTKTRIYDTYKIPTKDRKQYTIDHFIMLSVGGSNDIKNLWPEHKSLRDCRAPLEYHLFLRVKEGKMTVARAHYLIKKSKLRKDQFGNCYQGNLDNYIMQLTGETK